MFDIKYSIKTTISVKSTKELVDFEQSFTTSLDLPDELLYDNFHDIRKDYILDFLKDQVNSFLASRFITRDDIEVESYEIVSETSGVDVFFVNSDISNEFTLTPTIRVYVYPKVVTVDPPTLIGKALNSTTINWSWDADIEKDFAHYILDEKGMIVAQLPVGVNSYVEINLKSDTFYTRKLVKYNATTMSKTSDKVSIKTSTTKVTSELIPYNEYENKIILNKYNNFTVEPDEPDGALIEAFHSGIGDNKDLFVAKQTEKEFYEKFGLDMKLFGTYIEKKSVYEQVAFDYRIRAFGDYIVKENKGNLDMILHAYPIEYITYRIYRYGMRDVSARYRVKCQCKYYVYVPKTVRDFDGGTTTIYVLEARFKNLTSSSYDFTFRGTSTFDSSDGFAKLDFIPLSSGKPISSQTIYQIMNAVAASDSAITASGEPWTLFDYQVEDDYQFDEADNRYYSSGSRSFGSGIYGTLRTSARIGSSGMDPNSLVYAYGYAEACLFEIQQYVTHSIDMLDGTIPMLYKSEITTAALINIADNSQTLSSSDYTVLTKISVFTKERDIVVDTLDVNGLQSIISTCHIDPNSKSAQFKSDTLHYEFTSQDPYTMSVACEVIKGIDMSKNIDPVTDVALTEWRPREYKFVPEILRVEGDIDFGGKAIGQGFYRTVKAGQYIVYKGKGYYGVAMFANLVDVITHWEEVLPHLDTEPLHGIVNGRFDLNPAFNGKKDLLVTAPEFQIPSFIIPSTIRFNVLLSNVNPEKAFVSSVFQNHDENYYGIKNADIITFASDSLFVRHLPHRELIETIKHNRLELINEFEKVFDFTITKPVTASQKPYVTYDMEVRSDNNSVFVDSKPIDITFNALNEFNLELPVKYQQNSTGHWSPRIHNGYYYINNEEHFLYSDFKSEGDFIPIQVYLDNTVHYTIKCDLRKIGGQKEYYKVERHAEHEFIADRTVFDWDEKKFMLFPLPTLAAKRYREYAPETDYISSPIVFKKPINTCDNITWKFDVPAPATMKVYLRTFDASAGTDDGLWSDWVEATNGSSVAITPSSAIQFKVAFMPVTTNVYQDYIEIIDDEIALLNDMDDALSTNIAYLHDILQCDDKTKPAVFYSKIDDYGSTSTLRIAPYENQKGVKTYVAGSDDKAVLASSPNWVLMNGTNGVGKYRYLRYKIEMSAGSEVFMIYKYINEPVTTFYVPKFGSLSMDFTHIEPDHTYTFVEDYTTQIPFDTKWHLIVESITAVIAPIITAAGYDVCDLENIEITSNDKTTEIKYDTFSSSTNETAKMIDIFNKWKRFSHNTSEVQPASSTEANSWSYDSKQDAVACTVNSSTYIGFISDTKYDKYRHTATLKSTDGDDDIIGLILAYTKDSSGREYTLSAICSPGTMNGGVSDGAQLAKWDIMYNFGRTDQKIIASGNLFIGTAPAGGWAGMPNGVTMRVERMNDTFRVARSQWDSNVIDEDTLLTISLNSDPILYKFKGQQSYGYSCYSQAFSSFKDITFINLNALDGGMEARSLEAEYDFANSPYIIFKDNKCELSEIPQQFCPVLVQHDTYGPLQATAFYDADGNAILTNNESFVSDYQKVFSLKFNMIDNSTLEVKLNGVVVDTAKYKLTNNMLEFNDIIERDDVVDVSYKLKNSFCVNYDLVNNKTIIVVNSDTPINKARVMFETNKSDNKYIASHLSFNPIHNLHDQGFLYISYDTFQVHDFTMHCNPTILRADGKDTTQIYVAVKDHYGNPVPGETLEITNSGKGKIRIDDLMTDINGVAVIRYIAPGQPCNDVISVKSTSTNKTRALTIISK